MRAIEQRQHDAGWRRPRSRRLNMRAFARRCQQAARRFNERRSLFFRASLTMRNQNASSLDCRAQTQKDQVSADLNELVDARALS